MNLKNVIFTFGNLKSYTKYTNVAAYKQYRMEDIGMKKRIVMRLVGMAAAASLLLTATACSSQKDGASDAGSGQNAEQGDTKPEDGT